MQPKCNPWGSRVVDAAAAIPVVQEFLTHVKRLDEMSDPGGHYLDTPAYRETKDAINRSLPKIKALIDATDPSLKTQLLRGLSGSFGYSGAVAAVTQLLGSLESAETTAALVGPSGPNLTVSTMHSWVRKAAGPLWEDGHHAQAVQTAASCVFDTELPAKLGLQKGARGTKPEEMVGKAFDETAPLLTIPGYTPGTQNWTNVYQGAKHLGLACAKLVRNLGTHNVTAAGNKDELLEDLALLSRFARIIDSSSI